MRNVLLLAILAALLIVYLDVHTTEGNYSIIAELPNVHLEVDTCGTWAHVNLWDVVGIHVWLQGG